jgi:hypothetical protein
VVNSCEENGKGIIPNDEIRRSAEREEQKFLQKCCFLSPIHRTGKRPVFWIAKFNLAKYNT